MKPYNCPVCDTIMPYKDRNEHKCNPFTIQRKLAVDDLKMRLKTKGGKNVVS